LSKGAIGNSAAVLLMIGLMLPFFFLSMYERDGRPAEKVLRDMLRLRLWPAARPYRTENLYQYIQDHPIAEEGEGDAFAKKSKGAKPRKSRR
jgi:hypothetical protein